MNLLLDYLPIVAFVVAYRFFDIYVATAVLIVGVVGSAALQWVRDRKINTLMLISAGLVLVLGGITLALRNEAFIQWKPSVASWAFAIVFVLSRFVGKKTMVEQMMGEIAPLDHATWRKLNYLWALFWVVTGLVNVWLLASFDLTTWVNWHLPILFGLSVIFFGANGYWLATKAPPETTPAADEKSKSDP
jgi:intracellular septation protein